MAIFHTDIFTNSTTYYGKKVKSNGENAHSKTGTFQYDVGFKISNSCKWQKLPFKIAI